MSNEMTPNDMTPRELPHRELPSREPPGELCREAQHYLHQYVEGELDPIRSGLIREHLKACAACQKEREALEAERLWFLEAMVDAPLLSGRFQEKILEKVRKAKRQAALRRLLGRAGSFAAAFLVIGLTAIQFQRTSEDHPLPPRSSGRARAVTSAPTPAGLELPAGLEGNRAPLLVCGSDCSEPDSFNSFSPLTDRIDHARLASGGPPLSRAGARTAPIFVSNFGDVAGMASQLTPSSRRVLPSSGPENPCKPDPNKDGKMDLNDVAYSCQLLIGGLEPRSLETRDVVPLADFPLVDPDCDDICLKA